jgi:putative ABC transport system permease protein
MPHLWPTVLYVLRLLRRAPGFTVVAVLTLGVGIGACTAIYTVVHAVLLAPLPYPEPDRLVHLWQINAKGGQGQFSDPNFEDVHAQSRSFQALAQYAGARSPVVGGTTPVRARIVVVSREIGEVLRMQPFLGRWFVADEQRSGGRPAVIVSHAFWQQYLAGDSDLSRHTLTFDGQVHAVVGVMPRDVRFPVLEADLWVPRELTAPLPSRTAHNWRVIGRLRDGVGVGQARSDVHALAMRLKQQYGDATWMSDAVVVPLREEIVRGARLGLLILLGGAGFLLLIACANVVNLLLARATAREREVAVRAALGASRGRLLLPFVIEAAVLAVAGAALGIVLARAGVQAWLALEQGGLPRIEEIRVSWPALLFAIAIAAGSAIAMGLLAGWRATWRDPQAGLREGGRSAGASHGTVRLRGALVVAQIATSLVLLVGAGLLARSVARLLGEDPGFRTEHLATIELSSPWSDDEGAPERLARFHDEVLARVQSLPGVIAAGGVNAFPMSGLTGDGRFIILSASTDRLVADTIARCGARLSRCGPEAFDQLGALFGDKSQTGDAEFRVASEQYFRVMGVPLLRGRSFDERDAPGAPHVALISESLARTRWPGQDPIGQRLEFGNMDGDLTPLTVIGVVGDIRERGLDSAPRPTLYGSARQRPGTTATFTIAVQATADEAWVFARARDIVRQLGPDAVLRFRTVEQVIAASISDRRVLLILLVSFAACALLLAGVGIYGVISYSVAQRTQEIGIRMALGAQPADVSRLVLAHGLRFAVAGLAIGIAVALLSTRVMASLLYGVTPADPLTYIVVALVLGGIALVAAQIPARRATTVDPIVALRKD